MTNDVHTTVTQGRDTTQGRDVIQGRDVARVRLRSDVAITARLLPTHYPLRSFIAVNPLAGLQPKHFDAAAGRAGALYGVRTTLSEASYRAFHAEGRITDADLEAALARRFGTAIPEGLRVELHRGPVAAGPSRTHRTLSEQHAPRAARTVDERTSTWCAAYLGADEAAWAMPGHERGFYPAWRELAWRDRSLPRGVRAALRTVPERPDDAVLDALETLGVAAEHRRDYLLAHLSAMPGWAAHVRWRAENRPGVDTLDYLAMRLSYEALLAPGPHRWSPPAVAPSGPTPQALRELVWQEAYEEHYRTALLARLGAHPAADPGPARPGRPDAQLVCCIDVRSEGLRRHLEGRGNYATLGFAGFFAVAIRFTPLSGGASSDLCPVLIQPGFGVAESPDPAHPGAAGRELAGRRALAGAEEAFHAAKDDVATPFALAEAAGWAAAPLAAAKTLAPRLTGSLRRALHRLSAPAARSRLEYETGFPLVEQVRYAHVALQTMGLTTGFARLVVFCGHGAATENNPYQASLDCGACGGHPGGPNARTAVSILNDAAVRAGLREGGVDVPDDTVFVAAEHDTATDAITVLDAHLVPASHGADLTALGADLDGAGRRLAAERAAGLPGGRPRRASAHVQRRSADWAQVYPEWGLAGNAAFVVGPRRLTRGVDLARRAFLHSYEPDVDPEGTALETIMTAPLVVAQWINAQYYFSTVAPDVFGAGTKTIHNVVGGVGVLAGHNGDLQLGLPWQSVAVGETLVHEPMRLLTVIEAPLARIDAVIARNSILQELFGNAWISLTARDGAGQPWQRWTPDGWVDDRRDEADPNRTGPDPETDPETLERRP